ncbi:PhoX family protein [Dongia deserti]|uniref:PhoX family protein n=1 Tax=Dongia deserti TaxID=2268030 RepID=UPI000E659F1C|nr:PhoX family phosphatase [Dongia deserti]
MTEDRHYRIPRVLKDEDDLNPSNPSPGATFQDIAEIRFSRRAALKGLLATSALTAVGTALAPLQKAHAAAGESTLKFSEIPHAYDAEFHVADGYEAQILLRWGDKVLADAPEFTPGKLTAEAQAKQFGYNCDFIGYMPLPAGSDNSENGLLFINHEYTIPHLMFPGFADDKAAFEGTTADSTAVELEAHGGTVVEVKKEAGAWKVVDGSKYNRRITLNTEMEIGGPAAGHDRMKTSADPTGRKVLGMINNCAGGWTPWGTILTGEENFHQYFGGDPAGTAEATNHKRYGIKAEPSYPWGKFVDRFDVTKEPNEPNRFGWIVEVNPYEPDQAPVKRTALGRFKHEGAQAVVGADGRVVAYTGDDERFEYVYKYVSNGTFDPAAGVANSALLDDGVLHVAKFSDDGNVDWLPLVHGQGELTEANGFKSQADVLIEARRAADLLGATKMDRPEDIEADPKTGKVYLVLTKNDKRKPEQVDAVNARADNKWGHIVELTPPTKDGKLDHAAAKFAWNIFIQAGNPKDAAQGAKYGGEVSESGWFACPDNVAFDPKGRIWIATDGFPDFGIHDGVWAADLDGAGRAITKHFLGCPRGAELCGPVFTPDGQTLFVAVQHPAEEDESNFDKPTTRWPDFADGVPPRPSVLAIVKKGGGEIGS